MRTKNGKYAKINISNVMLFITQNLRMLRELKIKHFLSAKLK